MNNRKGAIELSMSTVVIIVLGMTLLIGGIVFVQRIVNSSIDNIATVDDSVKKKISELFGDDEDRVLVLFPTTNLIKLKQGQEGAGFALSLRNTDGRNSQTYGYEITRVLSDGDCPANIDSKARISAGQRASGIVLGPGSTLENPWHVRFAISDDAPTCLFRLKVSVTQGGTPVTTDFMDVQIVK